MKYRVWCKNKQEWEKDQFALLGNGQLIQLKNMQPLRKETHIIELSSGLEDKNGISCFNGDVIKWNDGVMAVVDFEKIGGGYRLLCSCRNNFPFIGFNIALSEIIGNIHEGIFIDKEGE